MYSLALLLSLVVSSTAAFIPRQSDSSASLTFNITSFSAGNVPVGQESETAWNMDIILSNDTSPSDSPTECLQRTDLSATAACTNQSVLPGFSRVGCGHGYVWSFQSIEQPVIPIQYGYQLTINYTAPDGGKLLGCHFFEPGAFGCVTESDGQSYERYTGPANFTVPATTDQFCVVPA